MWADERMLDKSFYGQAMLSFAKVESYAEYLLKC